MNKSTIPSLHVEPELLAAVGSLLQEGETLSGFVEQSLRLGISRRRFQQEFIARGLASAVESKRTNEYFDSDEVLREMDEMLLDKERTDNE